MIQLLRRAWDALDSFKQAYPENWHEEDQAVMDDLMKTDLDLSGVKRKWVGLTDEEVTELWDETVKYAPSEVRVNDFARAIEQALKEKNS